MTKKLIDRNSLENFIEGDAELLADLSVIFVRFLPGPLARMSLAVENRDLEMLRETAHQLKSQLSYFFCQPLVKQASQLEELAKAGQIEEANTKVQDVSKNIDRLLEELRALTNLELVLEDD